MVMCYSVLQSVYRYMLEMDVITSIVRLHSIYVAIDQMPAYNEKPYTVY